MQDDDPILGIPNLLGRPNADLSTPAQMEIRASEKFGRCLESYPRQHRERMRGHFSQMAAWLVLFGAASSLASERLTLTVAHMANSYYDGCRDTRNCGGGLINVTVVNPAGPPIGPVSIETRPTTVDAWTNTPPSLVYMRALQQLAALRGKGEEPTGIRLLDADGCESVSLEDLMGEESELVMIYEPREMVSFNLTVIGPHGQNRTLPVHTSPVNCGDVARDVCQVDTVCLLRKYSEQDVADEICALAQLEKLSPQGSRIFPLFNLPRYMGARSYDAQQIGDDGRCLSCERMQALQAIKPMTTINVEKVVLFGDDHAIQSTLGLSRVFQPVKSPSETEIGLAKLPLGEFAAMAPIGDAAGELITQPFLVTQASWHVHINADIVDAGDIQVEVLRDSAAVGGKDVTRGLNNEFIGDVYPGFSARQSTLRALPSCTGSSCLWLRCTWPSSFKALYNHQVRLRFVLKGGARLHAFHLVS